MRVQFKTARFDHLELTQPEIDQLALEFDSWADQAAITIQEAREEVAEEYVGLVTTDRVWTGEGYVFHKA